VRILHKKQKCTALTQAPCREMAAIVDLSFFSGGREDNARRFWTLWPSKRAHEAFHRLIAARKTVVGLQVLPDRLAITSTGKALLDQLPVRFTDTGRWRRRGTRGALFF
jgi:hypothetical protein